MRQPLDDVGLVEGQNELNIQMVPLAPLIYTIEFRPILDGFVRNTVVPAGSWSELRNGPGVDAYSGPSAGIWAGMVCVGENKWFTMSRGIMLFDTRYIPPEDKILSACLSGYVFDKVITADLPWSPSWAIYPAQTSYDDHLVPEDFQGLGTQPVSEIIPYPSIVEKAYNDFSFTADGLKWIIPGDFTKLGTREATYDAPNRPPPGVRGSCDLGMYPVNNPWANKPPILRVTLER